jgi:hypothetical protein
MFHRPGLWGFFALLLVLLAGCAQPRTTVVVRGDEFSKGITLEGIPLRNPNNGILFWMLRSFVDRQTHAAAHQIYVEWTYSGPSSGRYSAADDTARPLQVTNIFKESCAFNKCDRTDTLGIAIDEETLRARVATGLRVKLSGQDGSAAILSITPQMISAQLAAEDRIVGSQAGVPPTTASALSSSGLPPPSQKPFLGLAPMDLPFVSGVMVARVDPGTPAEAAGFQVGDMLVSYNGQPVKKADDVRDLVAATTPGSTVVIEITRHKTPLTLTPKL